MFCANIECNFPLHTLLADAIECFGGSTELIHIFNHLGVVTSKDTHARYVEHVVTQYEEGNHLKDLIKGRFTVASLDNLDFLQSHAVVYCGDQHHSTHVTTIQVVQPKPSSLSAINHKSLSSQTQSQTTETQQSNHNLSLSSSHSSEAYHSPQQLSLSQQIQPSDHQLLVTRKSVDMQSLDFSSSQNNAHPCDHQFPSAQTGGSHNSPLDHWYDTQPMETQPPLLSSTQLVETQPSSQPSLSITKQKEGHHQLSLSEPNPPNISLNL